MPTKKAAAKPAARRLLPRGRCPRKAAAKPAAEPAARGGCAQKVPPSLPPAARSLPCCVSLRRLPSLRLPPPLRPRLPRRL